MEFKELIKNEELQKALKESNFVKPTEIQEKIMPLIIEGKDVLGQSKTGTGKTLAFAGPILEEIKENKITQTLILSPTRELAIQIASDIKVYAKHMNINITCVYGSSSIENQIKDLKKGSEIVIGTPGRVKDLIRRKKLDLEHIKYFVLDEADEMLSMGFQEDIESIFEAIKTEKQVLLFSATMPAKILSIAKHYMKEDYVTVKVKSDTKTADNIVQEYYIAPLNTRSEVLARILDFYDFQRVMVFVRTRRNADELLEKITKKGYNANVIHGDISQEQRIKTLDMFRKGLFKVLIATDVAARGIHVDDIDLVINYNLPESHELYVHRIGRTGRANKKGMSITFVTSREEKVIRELEKFTNSKMIKKELPTEKQILNNRILNIQEEIEALKQQESDMQEVNDCLNNLTKEELINVTSNLLKKSLLSNIGSNFDVSVKEQPERRNKKERRNSGDSIRVFLTIGKLDNIQKREFLSFIEKKAGLKEGTCTGVEILNKFTFMNVQKNSFDKLFEKCNNIKYKNRLIRIEKAKN